MVKRIAITGPESTGKSILAVEMALHYNTIWVPEFARAYLNQLNRPYQYDDILKIAKQQFQVNLGQLGKANQYLFCDTELIVTKIWCDFKFGQCHPWIIDHIDRQEIDLFLLMDIDLPWQSDPLREHPDKRKVLFDLYLKELDSHRLPYEIVNGMENARTQKAIDLLDQRFH